MEERREYNEVYGWMPDDIINKLPEIDRRRMFLECMLRKPTATGWFITRTVVAAMGEEFLDYVISSIEEGLKEDETPVTKEELKENLSILFKSFSADSNVLCEYIRRYRVEVLGMDDSEADPEEEMVSESKLPKRDSKGRFIKKK